MSRKWNRVVSATRTVHIYLTVFAMLLMVFFAATGLLLNHEEWVSASEAAPVETTGTLPMALLTHAPDTAGIIETLRTTYGALGALSTFDSDGEELRVELRGPGRRFEAVITLATGAMTITKEMRPFLIRMDDLHRGKDSGTAWSWLIDLSAILLLLGALTGITLWIALPKRRTLGLIALGLGVGVCVAVYLLIVP
ncbi:MAG: PepSY-associated TM helix domain-containing protein [Gemmatimonadetes bacterium]|jgi:hypothetical protein|nr:PepSY-associated TM helix domain-containing protein [Gemmatimonadota bacterium]MBP6442626.1 PepSY-associated TM helix domain-containing protein [Gemmatimonadales bacterium]MBP6569956.1 PepSY-associated TM helix domain-containing protein [Gemmatimonadales bacterium]MBP7619434.1 PepSY-associated TM helix domain-containing protein [Gemmatimonadales bacterium]MBP9898965.1 PepSY-associated TM helix domain-containing protein [Gemmatimonadales bacterium]